MELGIERNLNPTEKQGLMKAFEFTHELAWNVFKDFFKNQGNNDLKGSKDATRQAFKEELIIDGFGWMEMIKSRNQSAHTYNEDVAEEIILMITNIYLSLFYDFQTEMNRLIIKNRKN